MKRDWKSLQTCVEESLVKDNDSTRFKKRLHNKSMTIYRRCIKFKVHYIVFQIRGYLNSNMQSKVKDTHKKVNISMVCRRMKFIIMYLARHKLYQKIW